MYKRILILVLVSFIFIGCSEDKNKNSEIVTNDISGLAVDNDNIIVIDESKLGQQFLLITTSTPQQKSLEFEGSKSRVVMFEIHNGLLYMLESPQGHISDADLDNDIVLAEFPITKQSGGKIYFDFNVGMNSIYNMLPAYWVSDFSGTEYSSETFINKGLNIGYLKSVEQNSTNGRLWLKQIVQVNGIDVALNGGESQLSVDYYLSAYESNSSFVPKQSAGFEKVGYFETHPQLTEHGVTKQYANKFNLSKGTVTYAISSNTPQKYRQAIREGVEYWNSVLGETLVRVIDAPKGVQAPHPEYNIIQWQDDVTAQYAYASFNNDPLSGELLHAQIYLPSVWTERVSQDIVYELNLQQDMNSTQKVCKIDIGKDYSLSMLKMRSIGVNPLEIENISYDLVRYAVSHEVGHTLGLRHNFGGSATHEYHDLNSTQIFTEYSKSLSDDITQPSDLFNSVIVTSSIMDYPNQIERMVVGYQIKKGHSFSYDKAAIRYLYKDEEPELWPFFCTDTAVGNFVDCQIFDSKTPLLHNVEQYNNKISLLPYDIFNEFIDAKASSEWNNEKTLEEVMLYNFSRASNTIVYRYYILELFSSINYLKPMKELYLGYSGSELNAFYYSEYLDNNLISEISLDSLTQQLQELFKTDELTTTQVSSVLKPLNPQALIVQWRDDFDKLLVSKSSGEGLHGDYIFTSEEQTLIQEKAHKFFERLAYEFVTKDILTLSISSVNIIDGVLGEGLLLALKGMQKDYLFLTKEDMEPLIVQYDDNSSVIVELPQFALNWSQRNDISMLLSSNRVSKLDSLKGWGEKERIEVSAYYKNYFNTLLEPIITHLKAESFDSAEVVEFFDKSDTTTKEWYLEIMTVYGALYEKDS